LTRPDCLIGPCFVPVSSAHAEVIILLISFWNLLFLDIYGCDQLEGLGRWRDLKLLSPWISTARDDLPRFRLGCFSIFGFLCWMNIKFLTKIYTKFWIQRIIQLSKQNFKINSNHQNVKYISNSPKLNFSFKSTFLYEIKLKHMIILNYLILNFKLQKNQISNKNKNDIFSWGANVAKLSKVTTIKMILVIFLFLDVYYAMTIQFV